jgi:2-oxoglutarate dehydrogenase E2 component (dihydrolipoamide succinyltransferase)
VSKGEGVVELEKDKVNIEVNSDYTGVLTQVLKEPGDTIEVGDVIAILEDNLAEGTTPAVSANSF